MVSNKKLATASSFSLDPPHPVPSMPLRNIQQLISPSNRRAACSAEVPPSAARAHRQRMSLDISPAEQQTDRSLEPLRQITQQLHSPATAEAQQRPRTSPADSPASPADFQRQRSQEGGPRRRSRSHRSRFSPAAINPRHAQSRLGEKLTTRRRERGGEQAQEVAKEEEKKTIKRK